MLIWAKLKRAYMQGGGAGGRHDPPPKPTETCIGWVEKREKTKGKKQAKIGKRKLENSKKVENGENPKSGEK